MNSFFEVLSVVVVGLIGGVAVALQGPMSGVMSQRLGPFASSLIIHAGGALVSALFLIVSGGVNLREVQQVPRPFLFAGALGVVLYLTFAYTLPRVGATVATALLIVAQLVVGLILDHFGWLGVAQHPFSFQRFLGLVFLTIGAWLVTQ